MTEKQCWGVEEHVPPLANFLHISRPPFFFLNKVLYRHRVSMLAEACLKTILEGSEVGLTHPEDRQLIQETRKFCQTPRDSISALSWSSVLPALLGLKSGWQQHHRPQFIRSAFPGAAKETA
jgi:hypothetical protein